MTASTNLIFPVQDSTLSAEALAESVLSEYGLFDRPVCRFYRKGICDTYRVTAGDRGYYLKVYRHGRRTRLDVSEEVRLLNYLAENGVSVARPVARLDGTYVNRLAAPEGVRYAVLFEAAPGVAGDQGDLGRIAAFGEMVGRMHQVADRMEEPYRRVPLDMRHLVDDNLPAIEHLMAHREADFGLIVRIAEACKAESPSCSPRRSRRTAFATAIFTAGTSATTSTAPPCSLTSTAPAAAGGRSTSGSFSPRTSGWT